jgi:hypothetical protein
MRAVLSGLTVPETAYVFIVTRGRRHDLTNT